MLGKNIKRHSCYEKILKDPMDLFFIKVVVIVREKILKSHVLTNHSMEKNLENIFFIHNKRFDNNITITQ